MITQSKINNQTNFPEVESLSLKCETVSKLGCHKNLAEVEYLSLRCEPQGNGYVQDSNPLRVT